MFKQILHRKPPACMHLQIDKVSLALKLFHQWIENSILFFYFQYLYIFTVYVFDTNLGTVINNLLFQTSKPSGKLFPGWYRPVFIASSFADSSGHAYETSFHRNFSWSLAQNPLAMHEQSNKIDKNLVNCIF